MSRYGAIVGASLALLASQDGAPAAKALALTGVTFAYVTTVASGHARFELDNSSSNTYEYLSGIGSVPVLAYDADKRRDGRSCAMVPDLPQMFVMPLRPSAKLPFEYTDVQKVQVFGVYVRKPHSQCWQLVLARRP
jgi:hypothetical protein